MDHGCLTAAGGLPKLHHNRPTFKEVTVYDLDGFCEPSKYQLPSLAPCSRAGPSRRVFLAREMPCYTACAMCICTLAITQSRYATRPAHIGLLEDETQPSAYIQDPQNGESNLQFHVLAYETALCHGIAKSIYGCRFCVNKHWAAGVTD